jgi:F-type H+-transporting ATPase subunit epsilon
MGVLADHVPLLTQILPGEVIVRKAGRDSSLAVGEGLVEITARRVAILTDMAIAVEQLDEARIEQARQRAMARLNDKLSEEEVAGVNAALVRTLAQLRVKRRHHG